MANWAETIRGLRRRFRGVDHRVTRWMAQHGVLYLRISLGVVFLWFGFLKFFPGLSPAEDLSTKTMRVLTFGLVQPSLSLPILAAWECLIGVGLLTGIWLRAVLALMALQMAGTITPMLLFPDECFVRFPFAPSLEGQYIIKNVVLISAGLVVGATVRGGALVRER